MKKRYVYRSKKSKILGLALIILSLLFVFTLVFAFVFQMTSKSVMRVVLCYIIFFIIIIFIYVFEMRKGQLIVQKRKNTYQIFTKQMRTYISKESIDSIMLVPRKDEFFGKQEIGSELYDLQTYSHGKKNKEMLVIQTSLENTMEFTNLFNGTFLISLPQLDDLSDFFAEDEIFTEKPTEDVDLKTILSAGAPLLEIDFMSKKNLVVFLCCCALIVISSLLFFIYVVLPSKELDAKSLRGLVMGPVSLLLILFAVVMAKVLKIKLYDDNFAINLWTKRSLLSFEEIISIDVIENTRDEARTKKTASVSIGRKRQKQALFIQKNDGGSVMIFTPHATDIESLLRVGMSAESKVMKEKKYRQLKDEITERNISIKKLNKYFQTGLIVFFVVLMVLGLFTGRESRKQLIVENAFPIVLQPKEETTIDVFQYGYLFADGVEDNVLITFIRGRDDAAREITEIEKEYLQLGTYYYNDIEFEERPTQGMPYKNGDEIILRFDPDEEFGKSHKITPTRLTKTEKLNSVGRLIKEETISEYATDIYTLNDRIISYTMEPQERTIEGLIRENQLSQSGVYYKVEPHFETNSNVLRTSHTAGLTLFSYYEVNGKVYLRGSTNIYGWGISNNLSYGDNITIQSLGVTEEELTPENIDEAMNQRGFQKYQ